MRFLTPLRKPTAVLLSLALQPWQPLAALAGDVVTAPVAVPASYTSEDVRIARELGFDLAKPKERLDVLTKAAADRFAELRRDDLAAREAAALAPALTALKGQFPDRALPLTSLSSTARPVVDAFLANTATHYALVSAVLDRELPKIRVDLVTARDGLSLLDKPRAQRAEADWVAIENAAEPVAAALRGAKDALARARDKTPAVERPIAVEFEGLLDLLREAHKKLESKHRRADFAAELAARPRGEADAAATELLNAAAAPLQGRPEMLGRLAGAQASLSLFLRSGDEAQLSSAIAEMARVYDAAGVSKEEQARIFARVGGSAAAKSARTTAEAATLAGRTGEPTAAVAGLNLTTPGRVSDLRPKLEMPHLSHGAEHPVAAAVPPGPTALERLGPAFTAVVQPLTGLALDASSPLNAALDALPGSGALADRLATAASELDRRGLLAEADAVTAALARRRRRAQELERQDRASSTRGARVTPSTLSRAMAAATPPATRRQPRGRTTAGLDAGDVAPAHVEVGPHLALDRAARVERHHQPAIDREGACQHRRAGVYPEQLAHVVAAGRRV